MKKFVSLTLGLAAISLATAKADTIADWTFETTSPTSAGPLSPEIGSGSALGSHAGAATYSSPAGNGSSHSYSVNTWAVNDYWEFDFSTVGDTSIKLSYDQTSSSTGPGSFGLFYSVNGGAYTQIGANYTVLPNASPNAWNATTASSLFTFTPDFSSLGTALENNTTVSFRIYDMSTVSANGGTVASGGTDRIDNFIVTATSVPEPTTVSLGLMGGLASFFAYRRRNK